MCTCGSCHLHTELCGTCRERMREDKRWMDGPSQALLPIQSICMGLGLVRMHMYVILCKRRGKLWLMIGKSKASLLVLWWISFALRQRSPVYQVQLYRIALYTHIIPEFVPSLLSCLSGGLVAWVPAMQAGKHGFKIQLFEITWLPWVLRLALLLFCSNGMKISRA